MLKFFWITLAGVVTLGAQPVRDLELDPLQVINLPVSREITTVMFPEPITAVAGSDLVIESGKGAVEEGEEEGGKFQVAHAPGANFIMVRSLKGDSTARMTIIFEGAAYVFQLEPVLTDSVASVVLRKKPTSVASRVDSVPSAVKFTPRIGLSLLDRARAYPVLASSLPRAVEGVTKGAHNLVTTLPDLEITVQEVYRFSKEDALVFLLKLRNTSMAVLDLAPSTFAARVSQEKFEQSIANGPRTLAPGEQAEAEFAIVGQPDGSRNDLSADNAFTILVNYAKREVSPVAKVASEAAAPAVEAHTEVKS
jgi:hypothetical protein